MSSSDQAQQQADEGSRQISPTTRVFMGGSAAQQSLVTVEEIQGRNSLDRWSKEVEQEVMQRVQAKAAAKAKEILAQAQQEAKEIKQNAQVEGFNQGLADAQAELQQAHQEMAASLGEALASVQQGRDAIWQTHRQDLIALLQLAVERVLNIEIGEQRKQILAGFLDQAVEALDNLAGLSITVHPDDEPTIQDILAFASQQHPQLQAWRVRTRQDMQPGGLLVESDHGMVDNTIEGRRAIVQPIVEQLELPLPEGMEPQEQAAAAGSAPQDEEHAQDFDASAAQPPEFLAPEGSVQEPGEEGQGQ